VPYLQSLTRPEDALGRIMPPTLLARAIE
jgi:hypothetical protein